MFLSRFPIGYLRYEVMKPYAFPPEAIAGITVGTGCLVLLFLVVLVVYRRKSTQAEREYKRIQIQMDTLESNVRSECKLGNKQCALLFLLVRIGWLALDDSFALRLLFLPPLCCTWKFSLVLFHFYFFSAFAQMCTWDRRTGAPHSLPQAHDGRH